MTPFRLDGPGYPKAIFHDRHLGEGLGIVHQRRKMCAASYQSGHIELVIPSIPSEPNAQHPAADWTRLYQPRHIVGHADHLWNSFHIASNSARCPSTQRRACFKTLFGASPASKSPFEIRIFAAKSVPLICTCGGFSSWKNIMGLKLPNRLISGIRAPAIASYIGQYLP